VREFAAATFEVYLKPCADSGDETVSRKTRISGDDLLELIKDDIKQKFSHSW